MTDEEADQVFLDRAKRLKLHCCVCESEGWNLNDDLVPLRNMIVPSCSCDDHAVCTTCFSLITTKKVTDLLLLGQKLKAIDCQYPYAHERCAGVFNRQIWSKYVPISLFQRHKQLSSGFGYIVNCSQCKKESRTEHPEGEWTCQYCNRLSCGRCDVSIERCVCKGVSQHMLLSGYSRTFSKKSKDGIHQPIRRNQVSISMILNRIKEMKQHSPWFHAQCPSCESPLYKSSACNDMIHCGKSHVCYFCLERSFPWEKGFDKDHWNFCPRWDHDIFWFPCRDGECSWEGKECSDFVHAPMIKQMHETRWNSAMNLLRRDNVTMFDEAYQLSRA
jgi:hypothetical protein